MSSTKRGGKRHISDYYVTPIPAIVGFLERFCEIEPSSYILTDFPILDPCAGGDAIHPMSYPTALAEYGFENIDTLDVREDSPADFHSDFFAWTPNKEYGTIISNPPFVLAMEFIKKSLEVVCDDGFVIMLLRLNFFGSRKRKSFWDKFMPKYAFVHHERMSFTEDGKTDSIEYMHAVWQKGCESDCKLFVI